MRVKIIISLLVFINLVLGCTTHQPFILENINNQEGIRLLKIDYIKQQENGYCGVACLEEVLRYWGKNVPQKEIWNSITKGNREEIIADELKEYVQQCGFGGFILKGNFNDIYTNIEQGRPLIIAHESTALDRKIVGKTDYHYVVVIGYNKTQDYFILDDPADIRYYMPTIDFNEMWKSGFYFLLLVAPEERG